jgi:DNA-binding NarL/FixJ family response regulator
MKVLLIDDHPLFRMGLATAIEHMAISTTATSSASGQVADVHSAGDLQSGLVIAKSCELDIVILDYHLPDADGVSALVSFAQAFPFIPRIVISGDDRQAIRHAARQQGASAFIPKTQTMNTIWAVMNTVMQGHEWWPDATDASDLLSSASNLGTPEVSATLRQLEVLQLIAQGQSNRSVAQSLGISERTVKQHMTDLFAKSGTSNRTQLVHVTRKLGWIV